MKFFKVALFLVFSSLCAFGQTTSTITGTIRDLTQALVTSGKVTFTLSPSRDTTISGYARFSPQTVTCGINGSGQVLNQLLSGACIVTMNTALQPTGSYYRVDVYPFNVKTSSFTFYAVLSSYDWSTVVPTPTTSPAQNFVDIFSNQSIAGNKTWVGAQTYTGNVTISGIFNVSTLNVTGGAVVAGGGSWTGGPTLDSAHFSTGVNNNASGFKHGRVSGCTTGATAGNFCEVTITWGTPFIDFSYTLECIGNSVNAVAYSYNSKAAASVNVRATTILNSASTVAFFDCVAVHD